MWCAKLTMSSKKNQALASASSRVDPDDTTHWSTSSPCTSCTQTRCIITRAQRELYYGGRGESHEGWSLGTDVLYILNRSLGLLFPEKMMFSIKSLQFRSDRPLSPPLAMSLIISHIHSSLSVTQHCLTRWMGSSLLPSSNVVNADDNCVEVAKVL